MKRKRLTNKQLAERIIELGALLGAFRKDFSDFRSGCNCDLDKAIERITALEDHVRNPCDAWDDATLSRLAREGELRGKT